MARYPNEIGGYFRMWSRPYLTDEKIQTLTDAEQGQFVRVLCVANECNDLGRFSVIGIDLNAEQVAIKSRVPVEFIQKLISIGILESKPFCLKNWEKYNPKSGEPYHETVKRIKLGIKSGIKLQKNPEGRLKTKDLRLKTKEKA